MLKDKPLTVASLLRTFLGPMSLTWALTLCETALMALVPLFIGFAIDDLLDGGTTGLLQLTAVLTGLTAIAVLRRRYDTRAYGRIRVEVGKAQVDRSAEVPVSVLNARLGMGRELVAFLEQEVPTTLESSVGLAVSLVVFYAFDPILSCAALGAAALSVGIYGLFHKRFYRLNAGHNQQMERQVRILAARPSDAVLPHLNRLRRFEIELSDTEAAVHGTIFLVLLGFVVFNIWFAASNLAITAGTIFSIVSYSWGFVEAALVLPFTLQGWSRLSEIMARINEAV